MNILFKPRNENEMILYCTRIKFDLQKIKNLSRYQAIKHGTGKYAIWLADELGIPVASVRHLLNGPKTMSLLYIKYIAEALNVNVDEIVDLGGYFCLYER